MSWTTDDQNQFEATKKALGFPQLSRSDKLWLWRYKARLMGYTVAKLARLANVRTDTMSHFFHDRADRAGRRNVMKIKKCLVGLGIADGANKGKSIFTGVGLSKSVTRSMERDFSKARKMQTKPQEE